MVKDLVPETNSDEILSMIIKEMREIPKISRLKEEDNVIRALIRGNTYTSIIDTLSKKYPEENITQNDLKVFLREYKDVLMKAKDNAVTAYERRVLKQQEGLTNELIDLAKTTKDLVEKFQEDKDNTNTIAAIRTAADIFMKVGKVEGIFNDKPEVNVNMQMDRVITKVAAGDSEFSKKINKIIDAEVVDVGPTDRQENLQTDS